MSEDQAKSKPMDLGVYNRPDRGIDAADVIAIGLTGVWLLGTGIYFLALKPDVGNGSSGGFLFTLLAVFLPVGLIWIGATVTKTSRMMREEAARLQGSIDAMRHAYLNQAQAAVSAPKPGLERKIEELAAAQKQTQSVLATFASTHEAPVPSGADGQPLIKHLPRESDAQPSLELGVQPEIEQPPITVMDFIGALNFPQDENDTEGFRQLRLALGNRDTGKLIRSAQDLLTLISQDGVYMDDLVPEPSDPQIWRSFAEGERGQSIASLGGVHDEDSLATVAGRMRSDAVFRDTAHHFLREFDKTFAAVVDVASDEEISLLADTRTARAFMLLGRVTGTFD